MFGYVTINEPELKIREFRAYRSFYCGVCRALQRGYGLKGRVLLNYDLTFLALLLTALYDEADQPLPHRCALHPLRRCYRVDNPAVEYAADMTVLLAYYQCRDNWQDDKNPVSAAEARLLRKSLRRIAECYPRQYRAADDYVRELSAAEQRDDQDIDLAAGLTGTMFGEIFVRREDEWAATLRRLGFFLGKFIYLMDAYEDLERDAKRGGYNPLLSYWADDDFERRAHDLLTAMMAEAARAFERLPILRHAELLRNIIYSGVWSKYELLRARKEKNPHGSL